MQKIVFDNGERRHVRLEIHAVGDAPFRIKSASWMLLYAGRQIDGGDCEINDHIIDLFLEAPEAKACYTLAITYYINDEVLVEQLELAVV